MVCLCLEAGEEGRKTVFGNGFPRRLRSHVDRRIKRSALALVGAESSALRPSPAAVLQKMEYLDFDAAILQAIPRRP